MTMQVPCVYVGFSALGRLMKSEAIGEGGSEQTIVTSCDLSQDCGQEFVLRLYCLVQSAKMTLADEHGFEGPHGPERYNDRKRIIFANGALADGFDIQVIT